MLVEDLYVVMKVAEFRNITAAAASLDISPATASATLKRVEKSLGFELFTRTTRQLRLSSAGERYLPQCEQALRLLEQAKSHLKQDLAIIDGELRIALSSDLGRNLVVPWLDTFMETHPNVSVRINISDSNVDFYRDSVDMALRYGSPNDANTHGFKICDVPLVLCASKGYLDQHGTPQHPDDLAHHNGLFYQRYGIPFDRWPLFKGKDTYKITMKGNRTSNDGDLVRRWCVAGKGIALKSALDIAPDLLAGNVISLLPDIDKTQTELWLLFSSRQAITPAARLLRDSLKEKAQSILQKLANKGLENKIST